MTEPEAIEHLIEQLTTDTGFIARLQRGEGLDREYVACPLLSPSAHE
jgi:hypothetical protein